MHLPKSRVRLRIKLSGRKNANSSGKLRMKPESGRLIHVGIDFVTIPGALLSPQTSLRFQQAALSEGLEYQDVRSAADRLSLVRTTGSALEISVLTPDPQIVHLLIVASEPKTALLLFAEEAIAATAAFSRVWSSESRQIIRVDATIREYSLCFWEACSWWRFTVRAGSFA
jgi:hypothetical protein